MALAEMTKRGIWREGYEYTETVADGATGNTVVINPNIAPNNKISCALIAGANTGKIQTTISSDASVVAGTATWSDWAKGNSTGTVVDLIIGPVSGIRCVSVSGEVKMEILT